MLAPSVNFYTSGYKVTIPTNFDNNKGPVCKNTSECHYYDHHLYCDLNFCICEEGYRLLQNNTTCVKCPGYDFICSNNCCAKGLICKSNICSCVDPISPYCPSQQGGVFVTASQIALSAALIMGIAALAMVIYRLCTKPTYETARQRAERRMMNRAGIDSDSYGNIRSSLSSMQIRIISRLRDRPPPYQGEHVPSVLQTVAQNVENPPSYNCGRDLITHLPPPYTEIMLNPSGYLNQSYDNTDEPSVNSINITINKNVTREDASPNVTREDTSPNRDNNNNNISSNSK